MADESSKPTPAPSTPSAPAEGPDRASAAPEVERDEDAKEDRSERNERGDRPERGVTDFVRRALSAGVGAASRSKDDIMRVAASEVRGWLEHLNLNDEIAKALAKMVIEVKTEIRFRPAEDGKLVPETSNDVKLKPSK